MTPNESVLHYFRRRVRRFFTPVPSSRFGSSTSSRHHPHHSRGYSRYGDERVRRRTSNGSLRTVSHSGSEYEGSVMSGRSSVRSGSSARSWRRRGVGMGTLSVFYFYFYWFLRLLFVVLCSTTSRSPLHHRCSSPRARLILLQCTTLIPTSSSATSSSAFHQQRRRVRGRSESEQNGFSICHSTNDAASIVSSIDGTYSPPPIHLIRLFSQQLSFNVSGPFFRKRKWSRPTEDFSTSPSPSPILQWEYWSPPSASKWKHSISNDFSTSLTTLPN